MLVGEKFTTRCQLHKTGMTYFFGEEDVHIFIAELSNQTWCAATAPAAGQFATDLVSNDMTCSCSFCRLGLVCASRPSPSWAERRKNIARRRTPSSKEGHFVTTVAAFATANQRAIQIHTYALARRLKRSGPISISARVRSRPSQLATLIFRAGASHRFASIECQKRSNGSPK